MKILLVFSVLVTVCWTGPAPHRRDSEEGGDVETIIEIHRHREGSREVQVHRDRDTQRGSRHGSCPNEISPLYAMYTPNTDTLYYTALFEDFVMRQVYNPSYWKVRKSPGFVSMSGTDCTCNPKGYKPIHLLNGVPNTGGRPGNRYDHFYVEEHEIEHFKKVGAYQPFGTYFFCSPEKDHCGASIPLMRYSIRQTHAFVSNEADGNPLVNAGAKYDGIMCYIWPTTALPEKFKGNSGNDAAKVYVDDVVAKVRADVYTV